MQYAATLTTAFNNALKAAEQQVEAAKQQTEASEVMLEGMKSGQQDKFDEAFAQEEERALIRLKRIMDPELAETYFEQHERPKIELALSRAYGV